MRSNIDSSRVRGAIQETAQLFLPETIAISADVTLAAGLPMVLAFDPASTGRNIILYTPTVTALAHKHEIFNISAGTGVLTIRDPANANTLGLVQPGGKAEVYWNPKAAAWTVFSQLAGNATQSTASRQVLQQYTTLAGIANSQVLSMAVPFNFTLLSVGFRTKIVASTASKLATLTAQVNGVSVTGGVISLTTANQNTSGGLTAGTTITAGNAGTAGQTVGVLASAVTAFVEGDGYVEYTVLNKDLVA